VEICATPYGRASELALEIYRRALEAVGADALLQRQVRIAGDSLRVGDVRVELLGRRVWVAGAGKAAAPMARVLLERVPQARAGPIVASADAEGLEVVVGGHPVPNEASLEAGRRMLAWISELGEPDLVLFALTGGASSLMETPLEDVSLEDLQEVNRLLLASGRPIEQVNAVRGRLSRLKAGGLARALSPAEAVVFVLSDVLGSDLRAIGSGPFVGDALPPVSDSLVDELPERLRELVRAEAETPAHWRVQHVVIGDVSDAVNASMEAARELGLAPVDGGLVCGEAREDAARVARKALDLAPGACLVFGGETTVTLRGKGRGGRCQEMACAAAAEIAGKDDMAALFAGTDGADGPTEFAGGLVDGGSLGRASSQGLSVEEALVENDSGRFLEACGGLISTSPTNSNVNDLAVIVRGPR
jgi:glycerate 2-kinase